MTNLEITPGCTMVLKMCLTQKLQKIQSCIQKLYREQQALIVIQEQIERQQELIEDELLIDDIKFRCN